MGRSPFWWKLLRLNTSPEEYKNAWTGTNSSVSTRVSSYKESLHSMGVRERGVAMKNLSSQRGGIKVENVSQMDDVFNHDVNDLLVRVEIHDTGPGISEVSPVNMRGGYSFIVAVSLYVMYVGTLYCCVSG